MSRRDQSAVALKKGQEALQRGNHGEALQALSISISYHPTIEGYYSRSEANFLKGDYDAAIGDIKAAQLLVTSDADAEAWQQRLNQAEIRFYEVKKTSQGPPVSQIISVMLLTEIGEPNELISRMINSPDLSTNGETLLRPGFSVLYDIEVLPAANAWVEAIIEISDGQLDQQTTDRVLKTAQFLHLQGPNQAVAQNISDQIELVAQLADTIEPLMRALLSPVVLLRCSNRVVTYQELRLVCDGKSLHSLIDLFVKIMNDGNCLFSVGMHQFGFADIEIPFSLLPVDKALDTLVEFMYFIIVNNLHNIEQRIEYETTSGGLVYSLQRMPEERFNIDGEARFNQFGIWKFMALIS